MSFKFQSNLGLFVIGNSKRRAFVGALTYRALVADRAPGYRSARHKLGLSSKSHKQHFTLIHCDSAVSSTYPAPQLGHFSIIYDRSIRMNRPVSENQLNHLGRIFLSPSSYHPLFLSLIHNRAFKACLSTENKHAGGCRLPSI